MYFSHSDLQADTPMLILIIVILHFQFGFVLYRIVTMKNAFEV